MNNSSSRRPIDGHRGIIAGPGAPVQFDPVEPGTTGLDPSTAAREIHGREVLRRARDVLPVAEAARAAAAARRSAPAAAPTPTSKGRERGGSGRPGGGSGPSSPRASSTSKGITPRASSSSAPRASTSKPVSSSIPAPSKRPDDGGVDVHMTAEEHAAYRRVLDWALRQSERQQIDADRASLGRTGHLPEQRFAMETRGSRR